MSDDLDVTKWKKVEEKTVDVVTWGEQHPDARVRLLAATARNWGALVEEREEALRNMADQLGQLRQEIHQLRRRKHELEHIAADRL